VRIIGWDSTPSVGASFVCVDSKKEAQEESSRFAEKTAGLNENKDKLSENKNEKVSIPIVLKADTTGSLEAVMFEIGKLETDAVTPKIILSGVGPITENDIKTATANGSTIVLGFNTSTDSRAENLIERSGIEVFIFDIIYKLTEKLAKIIASRTPVIEVEEVTGSAKILKTFSKTRDKQVVGGRVESGDLSVGNQVKIFRRESEIGKGKIKEIQVQKVKAGSVTEGSEFGMMIESKTEIAPGDKVQSSKMVRQ